MWAGAAEGVGRGGDGKGGEGTGEETGRGGPGQGRSRTGEDQRAAHLLGMLIMKGVSEGPVKYSTLVLAAEFSAGLLWE